jgi:transcriptional regulator with XRE-family HTH domain
MTPATVRQARQARGWTQAELAAKLGVSQAYVCQLERARRVVHGRLAETLVEVLELSPDALPLTAVSGPLRGDDAPRALGSLGYPGFAYLGGRLLNPAELLLRVLEAENVDARVVDALPWVLLRFSNVDWPWLLREAKANDLQNRLGFLLGVARELAALRGADATAATLAVQENALDGSRLQREDSFRASMTEAERRWLRNHRPAHAAHWNMLTTMTAGELARAY